MMKRLGNILLICFIISFILTFISAIAFYGFNDSAVAAIQQVCKVSPHDANLAAFYIFSVVKLIMAFGFLIPCIAIKMTENK